MVILIVAGVIASVALGLALYSWHLRAIRHRWGSEPELKAKDRFDIEQAIRASWLEFFARVLAIVAFALTLWQVVETQRQSEQTQRTTREQLQLSRRSQSAEQFSRASDSLDSTTREGAPADHVRLGAIYTLERVALVSQEDRSRVVAVLSAYARRAGRSKSAGAPRDDVAVAAVEALSAISYRERELFDSQRLWRLGLSRLNLRDLQLDHTRFRFPDLRHSDLSRAVVRFAILDSPDLRGTDLSDARFTDTWLPGVNRNPPGRPLIHLRSNRTRLDRTYFNDVELFSAYLPYASLRRSQFIDTNLLGADLRGADLRGAYFDTVCLQAARLEGARFDGAEIAHIEGLTAEQKRAISRTHPARQENLRTGRCTSETLNPRSILERREP